MESYCNFAFLERPRMRESVARGWFELAKREKLLPGELPSAMWLRSSLVVGTGDLVRKVTLSFFWSFLCLEISVPVSRSDCCYSGFWALESVADESDDESHTSVSLFYSRDFDPTSAWPGFSDTATGSAWAIGLPLSLAEESLVWIEPLVVAELFELLVTLGTWRSADARVDVIAITWSAFSCSAAPQD